MTFKNFTGLVSAQGAWSAVSAKAVAGALVFATVTSGYEKVEGSEQVEYPLYMVWAHNQWLRMPDATAFYTLKKQVENHETRIAALEEAKANFTVTDGKAIDLTYENGVLTAEAKISAKAGNGVSLENDGLFVDVKSLQDAIAAEQERAEGAEGDLQDAIDAEEERATGVEEGLDARIKELEDEARISIADNEKVLSLSDAKKLSTTLGLNYDETSKKIQLTGKENAVIADIDATAFIKDGMLNSAELVVDPEGQAAGAYIKLTFNTDAGKDPIFVNVSSFIDTYTSGDENLLKVENYVITPQTSTIKSQGSGLVVASDAYSYIKQEVGNETTRATGVEKGLEDRIEALEALEVTAEGDGELIDASADGYNVTVGATKKLSDAVAKVESLEVSAEDGVTLGDVTYKYTHPTATQADAAAVKVGRDEFGHVILGDALAAGDISFEDSGKHDVFYNADDVNKALNALANAIELVDQSETTLVKKNDDKYISLDDAAAEGSNDHAYSIGLVVATEPTLKDGLTSSKPTATGLASDKYVDDSITNALAWDVIA
ncbi:MAG: hypothetical protein Q4C49_00325 [Bacillota bacterium]|nr:hypothetical protein [Bacillota bacterium]